MTLLYSVEPKAIIDREQRAAMKKKRSEEKGDASAGTEIKRGQNSIGRGWRGWVIHYVRSM